MDEQVYNLIALAISIGGLVIIGVAFLLTTPSALGTTKKEEE